MDASVSATWFLPDEATPNTEATLQATAKGEVWVPALWLLEVGNLMLRAQRRRRITAAKRQALVAHAQALRLRVNREPAPMTTLDALAARYGAIAYDAAYLRAEIGGLVTVGLLPSTSDLLAAALVSDVRVRHPRILVRIAMGYEGTPQNWLESGDIDIALLYGSERLPNIEARVLLEEAPWAVGPPAAKLKATKPVSLVALAGKPLVLPSGPHGIRTLVDHACALAKVELTIAAETNAMSIQTSLVMGGHGLTILPPIACTEELARHEVTAAPLSDPTISRTIVLALPARRPIGRHVRATADLLEGCAKRAVHQNSLARGEVACVLVNSCSRFGVCSPSADRRAGAWQHRGMSTWPRSPRSCPRGWSRAMLRSLSQPA